MSLQKEVFSLSEKSQGLKTDQEGPGTSETKPGSPSGNREGVGPATLVMREGEVQEIIENGLELQGKACSGVATARFPARCATRR